MSTEEERNILDDMEKTGFPLEVDVTNWLMEKGWSVFPQYTYFDEHTKKIRAIDVLAFYLRKGLRLTDSPRLIVECKKSEKPWIFHCTRRFQDLAQPSQKGMDVLAFTSISYTLLSLFQLHTEINESLIEPIIARAAKIHFFNRDLPRAYSCHVAFRGQKNYSPDDFHKAIYQIRGTCLHLAKGVPKWPILATIVLRGKLFEYTRGSTREELKPRKHILFSTLGLIPQGEVEPSQYSFPPAIIDVVTDTYFSDYLKLLEKDFEGLRRVYKILKEGIGHE